MHMLLHVPRYQQERFALLLTERYPSASEVHSDRATTAAKRTPNGRHHSVVGYVLKSMSPQARWKSSMSYRKGSPILGKRAGYTANIGPKAIAIWRTRTANRGWLDKFALLRHPHRHS